MAEIRIEKKKPVWPWILLGLIILGIILYFVFAGNDNNSTEREDNREQMQDTTYSAMNLRAGDTVESNFILADRSNTDKSQANFIAYLKANKI